MMGCMKSFTRGMGVFGTELVLAGLAVFPAVTAAAPADKEQAATTSSVAADAQVVARDPVTGQLRAATPEEMQALQQSRSSLARRSAAAAVPQAKFHWSGAQGARLTEEFMANVTVVRMPDGRMVELCVGELEPAAKVAPSQPAPKSDTLPTE